MIRIFVNCADGTEMEILGHGCYNQADLDSYMRMLGGNCRVEVSGPFTNLRTTLPE